MIGIGTNTATCHLPIMDAASLAPDVLSHVRLGGAQATDARIPTYKNWPALVGIPPTNASLAMLKFKIPMQGASSFTFLAQMARDAKVCYFPSKADRTCMPNISIISTSGRLLKLTATLLALPSRG